MYELFSGRVSLCPSVCVHVVVCRIKRAGRNSFASPDPPKVGAAEMVYMAEQVCVSVCARMCACVCVCCLCMSVSIPSTHCCCYFVLLGVLNPCRLLRE